MTDWFHEAMNRIATTQQQKGDDYQLDHDPFSNFRRTGEQFNLATYEAAEFNMVQKLERLKALRYNGRAPQNETVEDTYKDLAVYAVLTYAMYLAETARETPANSSSTSGSVPGQHDNADQKPVDLQCGDCIHMVSEHAYETADNGEPVRAWCYTWCECPGDDLLHKLVAEYFGKEKVMRRNAAERLLQGFEKVYPNVVVVNPDPAPQTMAGPASRPEMPFAVNPLFKKESK
jgi:hypothetical protein